MSVLKKGYMPSSHAEQVAWSLNFHQKISEPGFNVGLSEAQITAFGTVNGTLQGTWTAASDPETRTRVTVANFHTALGAMKQMAKFYVSIIQGNSSVTDGQKEALRITVRKTHPTPILPPTTSPLIQILSVNGYQVKVRLRDSERPDSKARPTGVTGACILSFVGEAPPTDVQSWKLEGNASKPSDVTITFGDSVEPGSKVWFTAFWFNNRGSSPATTPVSTNIQFGGMDKGNIFSAEGKTRKAA